MIVSIRLTPGRIGDGLRFIESTLERKRKRSVGLTAARLSHDRPVRTIGVIVLICNGYFLEKMPVVRE
jgi:hypothetical protein